MKHSRIVLPLFCVFLILAAILDFRRGFLFPETSYLLKSPFFLFSPFQLILLVCGLGGLILSRSILRSLTSREDKVVLAGLFIILLVDFVFYRGVAMNRSLTAGKIGIDWLNAFGETGPLKSLYLSLSYILTVWHATFLSCLLGGWSLVAFPHLVNYLSRLNPRHTGFAGTLFSLTQPLCSCCVAVTTPGLFRSEVPRPFAISVLVGAPMLNISTLALAGILLPWPFSLVRIGGGIVVTLASGYVLGGLMSSKETSVCDLRATQITTQMQEHNLIAQWWRGSLRIALWLFPAIIFGILLTSFIWQYWPVEFTNSWPSVGFVPTLGSLLMISTWSEIPLALKLLNDGFTGPAAAALIALPAVNLGSLLLLGKATGHWKLVIAMGLSIMAVSFLVGMVFL